MVFKDARDYQILFLSSFLVLGVVSRDWDLRLDVIAVAFLACWLTQEAATYITSTPSSFRSATITALGLSLLLRTNDTSTMAIAATLAIASKFVLRVNDKHFFNPANFGIISVLLLTHNAWISPGQWGSSWWLFALFICTGGLITNRVGRWDTSVAFLLTYLFLEAIRNFYLGWSIDVLQHQLMSGSLLVFAFFMITDPRSIPNSPLTRSIWAMLIAVLSFILLHIFYLNTAFFWALFILSPVSILLDKQVRAPRFCWVKNSGNLVKTQLNWE